MLASLAVLSGLVTVVGTAPASAGPVDAGWAVVGPGEPPLTRTLSDGTTSAAAMTYNGDGLGASASWDFTTTATTSSATGDIKVPWTWQGLHAWFQVRVQLDLIVNGAVRATILNPPLTSCCTTPSNGFLYGGVATFPDAWVGPSDTYGFRLTGGNGDYNNFINGTFTLSTKPYLDGTIGQDNRQWLGAEALPAGDQFRRIEEAGEARWFKIPVVPGQQVTVNLSGAGERDQLGNWPDLSRDYDLALYGDIATTFDRLTKGSDLTQLAGAAAAGAPGDANPVPAFPSEVAKAATIPTALPSTTFAPRIYAPRIYAPRIYAPRIYAPRIYAPRIYAPRIYAPGVYSADFQVDPEFRDAFVGAQSQSLLAVSANTDHRAEALSAATGNTDGFFYVRVQGHDDQAFDTDNAFQLTYTVTGGEACKDLLDYHASPSLGATGNGFSTVIVTDTARLGLPAGSTGRQTFLDTLGELAAATAGTVVDLSDSQRILDLQDQARVRSRCPYAMNLVAREAKAIIDSYRNPASKYVVIAGGDDVVPFFRYPDTSGLGQESQFADEITLLDDSAAKASLRNDQVLSQDAYGARSEVTIGGATVPVQDLAVGRLVKTPDEIIATVRHYLDDLRGAPIASRSSLVTGYDFLEDAAKGVNAEFAGAMPGGRHDELIAAAGTPHDQSWKADDLYDALIGGQRHDLVYLAGHFSANDTLAADFATALEAGELDSAVDGHFTDTLVLSAGCHSGYNFVDGAAPQGTNTFDWTQAFAREKAVLIGGTGYQYGDSDFLEYSERLYLGIVQRLRESPTTPAVDAPAVAVGSALTLAKQDYLSSLSVLQGIDQKAVLQATLYGLPMTGVDFTDAGRQNPQGSASTVTPEAATTGPGAGLTLQVDDQNYPTPTTERTKTSGAAATTYGLPAQHTWLEGPSGGVTVQPGAPALPKQVENVSHGNLILRGVGFRGGSYVDSRGILPLTGAPAIEGASANTTFESPSFFPQKLLAANYFGALGESGRTSLILTPGQYVNDPDSTFELRKNIQRAYGDLDVRLFYTNASVPKVGLSDPTLAAAPGISDVRATVLGNQVTFSARVAGDPAAGVQQAWVTYTTGSAPVVDAETGKTTLRGRWQSLDLDQVQDDSTLWTKTLTLTDPTDWEGMRFLVQAANGAGAVALDTADGGYFGVSPADDGRGFLELLTTSPAATPPLGVTAKVTGGGRNLEGRTVVFSVLRGSEVLSTVTGMTDPGGRLIAQVDGATPAGRVTVRADLYDLAGQLVMSRVVDVVLDGLVISTPEWLATRAGTAYPQPLFATVVKRGAGPVSGVPVTFSLPTTGARATFAGGATTVTVTTNADGYAEAPPMTAGNTVGAFEARVSAEGADLMRVPMAAQYAMTLFDNPVNNTGTTTRSPSANTPLAVGALEWDDARLSDTAAAQLVRDKRVQVRWREVGAQYWSYKNDLATYDATEDEFRANLKGPSLNLGKGKHYVVEVRLLPASADPQPDQMTQRYFDLGRRSFELYLK